MDNENNDILTVPVLPLRGLVIFPGSILHFDVARKRSVAAMTAAMEHYEQRILITAQKDSSENEPDTEDYYKTGVMARILQIAKISESVIRVVVKGVYRAEALQYNDGKLYVTAKAVKAPIVSAPDERETEARVNIVKEMFNEYSIINGHVPQDMYLTVYEMTDAGKLADYIADNVIRDYHKKQEILELYDEEERLDRIVEMLSYENDLLMIEEKISEKTKLGMDDNQKEYYLRERIKAIREELGDSEETDAEAFEYRKRILELNTTEENKERLIKEVSKLEKMMSSSAEANVVRNYLDACLELPWGIYSKEKSGCSFKIINR